MEKRAVVTGGARGIGFEVASRLLERDSAVAIWDIDATAFEAARRELDGLGTLHTRQRDVGDAVSVVAAAQTATAALGGVDVRVNNAGYMPPGFFVDQPVRTVGKDA